MDILLTTYFFKSEGVRIPQQRVTTGTLEHSKMEIYYNFTISCVNATSHAKYDSTLALDQTVTHLSCL